jgi:protein-tyrosine phosphatase
VPAIDLHSHVLPGIDDGPVVARESLEICRRAAADGTGALAATPHVNAIHTTRPAVIEAGVAELNRALWEEGVPLEVLTGGEIAPTFLPLIDPADLSRLTLGGGPYLLLEAPLEAVGGELEAAVDELMNAGHGILLGHPERAPSFHREPGRLALLVERGVLCSITAGSLIGAFGRRVTSFTERLLADGLVHNVASDTHDPFGRPPALRSCLSAAAGQIPGLEAMANWLIEEVPAAILAGTEPPPAPQAPTRRPRRRGLSWRR